LDAALLDELEAQHRQVEDLFAQLEEAEDAATQQPLVDELVSSLKKHMEIEETQVYPEVAKLDGEMEQEAEIEHQLGRDGMTKLQELIGQPGFGAAVAMLEAGISHHVEEEENEVFPKLREALGFPATDTTKRDLYKRAQAAGIEGRSSMTKDELIAALRDHRKSTSAKTDAAKSQPPKQDRAPDRRTYEDRSIEELRERARELDIEGRSSMTKDELIAALRGQAK
jgi:hemerythrin superfamily protein